MEKLKILLYKKILKPILFLFDPEIIHGGVIFFGRLIGSNSITRYFLKRLFNTDLKKQKNFNILNIKFNSLVGLPAGFDKNGHLIKIAECIGFGFITVGTVTLKPYQGNKKPRLLRLKKSKGILVNFGLKNDGVKKVVKRIIEARKVVKDYPIFISIGKTNSQQTCSVNEGVKDMIECVKYIEKFRVATAYELNISCPNTFGGEPFTEKNNLNILLSEYEKLKIMIPTFIKMPINLDWDKFKELCDVISKYNIQGLTVGNLNKNRNDKNIKDKINPNLKGGVSGKPTFELSNNLIKKIKENYKNRFIIIGVGGIFSIDDAKTKLNNGANLIALITGMIYESPFLINKINKNLK